MFRSVRNTLSSLFGGSSSPLEEPDLEPDDYDHDLPWSADRAPTDAERRFLERAVADKHVSRDNATKQIELHAFRGARRMESSSDVYVASAGFGNEDLTTEKLERLYAESTRMMARWNQDLAARMQREYPDKRFTFVATSVAGQEGHRSLSNTRTHHLDSDKEVKHADVYVQELVGQSPVFLGGGGNSPEATDEESPPPVTTPMVTTKQRIRVPLDEDEEDQYAPPSRSIHELIAKKPAARKKAAAKPIAPRRNEPIPGAPTLIRKKKAAATPPLPAAPTVDSQATQQMEEFIARPPPSEQREWIDTSRTTPIPLSPSAAPSSKPAPPIVNRLPVVEVLASPPPIVDSQATQEMEEFTSTPFIVNRLPVAEISAVPPPTTNSTTAIDAAKNESRRKRNARRKELRAARRQDAVLALVKLQEEERRVKEHIEKTSTTRRRSAEEGTMVLYDPRVAKKRNTAASNAHIEGMVTLVDPDLPGVLSRFVASSSNRDVALERQLDVMMKAPNAVIRRDPNYEPSARGTLSRAIADESRASELRLAEELLRQDDQLSPQEARAQAAEVVNAERIDMPEIGRDFRRRYNEALQERRVIAPLALFAMRPRPRGERAFKPSGSAEDLYLGIDALTPIAAASRVSPTVLKELMQESEEILRRHNGVLPDTLGDGRYMLVWFAGDVINPLTNRPFGASMALVAENPARAVALPRELRLLRPARMSEERGLRAPLSGRAMKFTLEPENSSAVVFGLPRQPRETLPMARDYDERTLVATNRHARRPTLLLEAPLAEPPVAEPISVAGNRQPDVDGYLRPFKMSTHASEGHGVRDRRGRDVDTVSDKGVQRHIQPEELDTERIEPLSEKSNKHMTPRIAARHRYEAALQEFERMRLTPLTEATAWNSIRTVLLSEGASEADEREYIRELVGLIDARLLHLLPPPHPEYDVAKTAPVADEGPETPPLEPLFDFPELEEEKEEEEDEEQLPNVRILDTRPLRPSGYVPLPTSPLSRLPILSASEARDIIRRVRRSARIEAKRKRRPPAKYGSVYYDEEGEEMRGG